MSAAAEGTRLRRILVLDDNPSIVERFKNGLGKTGYVVRGATSVKQANDILLGGGDGDVCGMVVDRTLTEGAFAGIAFLAAVSARFPSMPTALMSGDLTAVAGLPTESRNPRATTGTSRKE